MEAQKDYSRQMISDLDQSLQQIRLDNPKTEDWARLSILKVELYLERLRAYIVSNPFAYRSEEVYFFKEVKPYL